MVIVSSVRKALESLYKGTCTVKTWESFKDPVTKISTQKEVLKFENQPCKLSHEKQVSATNTVGPAVLSQTTKLFIAPELEIPAGSKIIVSQNGKTTEFSRSGEPAVYMDHQEIMLELFKGYS